MDTCIFSFHVSGTNFDSDALSSGLNIVPTFLQLAGSPIIGADGRVIRIRDHTHWGYRHVGRPGIDQTGELRSFLKKLSESKQVLENLADGGAKLRIYYVILSPNKSAGESFCSDTIQLLAAMRISLDVEVFKDDCFTNEI